VTTQERELERLVSGETTVTTSPTNMQIGYFFFRLMLGMNLFFHGFMRILTGVSAWENPMAETFVDTFLPMPLVHGFLYAIPYIEAVLGSLTLLGLFTRRVLLAGVAFYCILMFGHCVRQNWSTVHVVMHYGLYYWILLVFIRHNWLALDKRLRSDA